MYLEVTGVQQALATLDTYEGVEMNRRIRAATLAGARALRGAIQEASPPHVQAVRKYPSDLRASVAVKVRKDALGFVGYVVGPSGRQGWVKHFVIGGTKPHREPKLRAAEVILGTPWGPRSVINHPGAHANPYVARVGQRYGSIVLAAMSKEIAGQIARRGF